MMAVAALAATGCELHTDTAGRRYRCEAGDPCPDGTSCLNGYCEQQDVVVDGGGVDGDTLPAEVCADGQLVAREQFDDLDEDVWWTWNNGDATVLATGGVLLVSSAVESNAGIIYFEDQDLAHMMASVEVGPRSSGGVGSLASLQLMDPDTGDAVLNLERGNDDLRAILRPYGPDEELLAAIDYGPEKHRFVRIITTGDHASFEYSSDEREWIALADRSITDLPVLVRPQLQSGSYGEVGQDQEFDLFTICRLP